MIDKKKICENCKYLDYEWLDDESGDEYQEFYCACIKEEMYEHKIENPNCHTCLNFVERPEPEPYKEKFTKCDQCEMFNGCYRNGDMINVTDFMDSVQHFVLAPWGKCPKEVGDILA